MTYTYTNSLDGFLRDMAVDHLQSIALVCGNRQITYQELEQRSNQLAHHLNGLGIAKNAFVGIYLERSIEIVIAILGVLKSGRTYVPLDPHYPAERVEFIAQETQVAILLTQEDLCNRLDHLSYTPKLCLDSQWHKVDVESSKPLKIDTEPKSLAYVMYTSGSTGKPKGVKMPRANVLPYIDALGDVVPVQAEDVYLHVASFSFSSSVRQLLFPLSVGATVVLATREQTKNPLLLLELMRQKNVTVFDGVPSVWRYALPLIEDSADLKDLVSKLSLKHLLLSGELTPVVLLENLRRALGRRIQFFNLYGQTETIGSTVYRVPENFDKEGGYVPVGFPYPHNQAFILDEFLNPVPVGEVGQLYMAGGCLAAGYMNRDDLTAEKFFEHPWPDGPTRIFNTGDLARKSPGGELEIVGRADFQVKIRGMRVELDEIAAVLEQHPEVKAAATAAHESATGEPLVVGYVVPYEDQPSGNHWHNTLRQYIGEHLPDYMVPALFMELEALPKTPSGKLDRRNLPKPESLEDRPLTEVEAHSPIQSVFCKAFHLSSVDPEDTFISLGGHSLLYVQFSIELERHLGFIPSDWENLTIAELENAYSKGPSQPQKKSMPTVETSLVLRAIAICGIIINNLEILPNNYDHGGAMVLLVIAGLNFARFQGGNLFQSNYRAIIKIMFFSLVLPYLIFQLVYTAYMLASGGPFIPSTLLLVSNFFGERTWFMQSWFVTVYIQSIVFILLLFGLKPIRKLANHRPWAFSIGFLMIAALISFMGPSVWDTEYLNHFLPHMYLWVFLVGWASHFSKTRSQKLWLTGLSVFFTLTVDNIIFYNSQYVWLLTCIPLLIWAQSLPIPRKMVFPIELIGAASYYIYMTYLAFFHIADKFRLGNPVILFLFVISGGILVWLIARKLQYWIISYMAKRRVKPVVS